nr:MAG TPA: hypothetical protein [Caudoviricetes sp.]
MGVFFARYSAPSWLPVPVKDRVILSASRSKERL